MATSLNLTVLTPEKEAVAPAAKDLLFDGFELILKLLSPDSDVADLHATMEALFEHLGVQHWEDMIVLSAKDVVDEIILSQNPGPLKSKLLQKHLGYIVKYVKHAT
jgi:hypothetical protein